MSQRYRVVIADDVEHLRTLLRIVLERSGHFEVVAQAANGRQAIEVAQEHQPDLTLLDLSMPIMDGLEALPQIRAAVPDGVVVVLSGFDADRMESRALTAGAAAYLVKGITPKELVSQLLDLVSPARAAVEPDADPGVVQLPADLTSPSQARTFVRQRLTALSREDVLDEAMLLTTELVTNAVIHAKSEVRVGVNQLEGRVRVEVADQGGGALTLKTPDTEQMNGRGLLLVEAMSLSWGTSADDTEKLVWFEL